MAKKKKNTIYTFFGKIGDIILIPIVVLSLVVSTLILFQRQSDKIPSVFGYSMVTILSPSMEKTGFHIGDNVFIKKVDKNDLWVGDIIAFFYYADKVDKDINLTQLESKDQQIEVTKPKPTDRTSINALVGKGYRVYFHYIVNVFVDESGTRFFETKGSSNQASDIEKIREDFVVGRYVETSPAMRSVLLWLTSPQGMIFCVCLPLGILAILQSLALIEQVNFMFIEKKLMKGEIHWQNREVKRLIDTGDMEFICKVIYPIYVEKEELDDLFENLWIFGDKLNNKQALLKDEVERSLEILKQKGAKDYLLFWKNNLNHSWDIKKIDDQISRLI